MHVMGAGAENYTALSCYQLCLARLEAAWAGFGERRRQRLAQLERYGQAAEKVAEEILTDCLTQVLDWPLGSVNYQVGRADLVLTTLGIKRLVIEAKRPGALQWSRQAVDRALEQAWRYARQQGVTRVAICDGGMLYAEDMDGAERRPRIFCNLAAPVAPADLWWLSQEGIYHPHEGAPVVLPAEAAGSGGAAPPSGGGGAVNELLDRKYHLPARCFAYTPDLGKPATWKLPYLEASGAVDAARLPKAIQCILTNYRGMRARIPEAAVPDILRALEAAARRCGHMPEQNPGTAPVYHELAAAMAQMACPADGGAAG